MTELRAQNTLHTLQRFVQKALIINYDSRNTEITQNGKNIASNLQL
jgi:hypothetical protein